MELVHSLDNLKSQLVSITICSNTRVYNAWNRTMIELPIVVSMAKLLVPGMGSL